MNIGILSPFNPAEFNNYLPGYTLPSICKSASSVNALVLGLLDQGHNVHVFTCAPISTISYFGKQLSVTIINNKFPVIGSSRNNRLFIHNRIVKAVKEFILNIDVIHAQWTYEYALAAVQFSDKVPVFCTVRDWCPLIIKYQKKITDKFYWAITSYYIFRQVFNDKRIHFIANSEYTYRKIINKFPQLNVDIVYNSIKEEFIKEGAHIHNSNIIFITIAQSISEPRKNISRLILAFNKYLMINPVAKLKMVGRDCVSGNKIIEEWRNKGLLRNVELCGFVNHDKLMTILDSCDVLIHPSLEETFGNILLEGMARKLLVIGGENAGAVPFVLEGGKAGILCDVTNEESIIQALIISSNRNIAETKIQYAWNMIKEKYSSSNIAKKQIMIYEKYCNNHDNKK